MQEINHNKGRVYYSMGEVAEMFDVNPSLLRFWEQEFDVLKPHRNKKGNRLFTPEDVDNIRIIYHLLKERKMKIEVARKYIKDYRKEVDRDAEITERLMNIRAILLEIKQDILYDGQVVDDSGEEYAYDAAELVKEAPQTAAQPKYAKKDTKPSSKRSGQVVTDVVANGEHSEPEIAVVEPAAVQMETYVKPLFEEQVLFEVAVPLELAQSVAHAVGDDGFESAKAAFMGAESQIPKEQEEEAKPRPQVIEQTLF